MTGTLCIYIHLDTLTNCWTCRRVLITEYSDDISDELSDQLLLLKMTFGATFSAAKSVKDLAEYILITHCERKSERDSMRFLWLQ